MNRKAVVFDIETLSPQKGVEVGKDVITAIGLKEGDDLWVEVIKPKGDGDVLTEEGDLIYDFSQELKKRKPDTVVGYNILAFDLPHLFLRSRKIGFWYNERRKEQGIDTRNLTFELMDVLSGLRFIDLFPHAIKSTGQWMQLNKYYADVMQKTPETEDPALHITASAQALLGKPQFLLDHLKSDLEKTFEIYTLAHR